MYDIPATRPASFRGVKDLYPRPRLKCCVECRRPWRRLTENETRTRSIFTIDGVISKHYFGVWCDNCMLGLGLFEEEDPEATLILCGAHSLHVDFLYEFSELFTLCGLTFYSFSTFWDRKYQRIAPTYRFCESRILQACFLYYSKAQSRSRELGCPSCSLLGQDENDAETGPVKELIVIADATFITVSRSKLAGVQQGNKYSCYPTEKRKLDRAIMDQRLWAGRTVDDGWRLTKKQGRGKISRSGYKRLARKHVLEPRFMRTLGKVYKRRAKQKIRRDPDKDRGGICGKYSQRHSLRSGGVFSLWCKHGLELAYAICMRILPFTL